MGLTMRKIFVVAFFITTQTVYGLTYEGFVIDYRTDESIAGAVVELRSTGLKDTTDTAGYFVFRDISVENGTISYSPRQKTVPWVAGPHQITCVGKNVQYRLYDLTGALAGSVRSDVPVNLKSLVAGKAAQGLYVAQIDNGHRWHGRYRPLAGDIRFNDFASFQPSRDASGIGKTARIDDTLVVEKSGYHTVRQFADWEWWSVYVFMTSEPSGPPPAGMKFIPGGWFMMGSQTGDAGETPVHEVTVSSFFMDSIEVTQKEYRELLGVEPWKEFDGINPGGEGDDLPVWYLSWCDAVLFCNKRSLRDGYDTVYSYDSIEGNAGRGCWLPNLQIHYDRKGYRLPTEAEWEYAARAGTQTDFYWGDEKDDAIAGKFEWYDPVAAKTLRKGAQKQPNQFGLYDMLGNICEYVNDWEYTYPSDPQDNPTGPTLPPFNDPKAFRVARGGLYSTSLRRVSSRMGGSPDGMGIIGIRCVFPYRP